MSNVYPALATVLTADAGSLANLTATQRAVCDIVREKRITTMRELTRETGRNRAALRETVHRAAKVLQVDPELAERLRRGGLTDIADGHSGWLKNDGGKGDSHYYMLPSLPADADPLIDALAEAVSAIREHALPYPAPPAPAPGGHMVVLDLADVHIGRLSAKPETGARYDTATAVARARAGTARLMALAEAHGVSCVVFVLGNDILHTDDGKRTTSGTEQDTDGTWHDAFDAARGLYVELIEQIAARYPVHLVFCPSNHDRRSGYALAQVIRAWFHRHPGVTASDYYLSPRPRKYLVYGDALLGFTHMDGIKDAALPALMQHEARQAWGQTAHAYWYTHHWHHKNRSRHGHDPGLLEKDLTGLTVINGRTQSPGDSVEIEVLRSPSAPDSWHTLSGHMNKQAVECYLHGPDGAQTGRFTAWF